MNKHETKELDVIAKKINTHKSIVYISAESQSVALSKYSGGAFVGSMISV